MNLCQHIHQLISSLIREHKRCVRVWRVCFSLCVCVCWGGTVYVCESMSVRVCVFVCMCVMQSSITVCMQLSMRVCVCVCVFCPGCDPRGLILQAAAGWMLSAGLHHTEKQVVLSIYSHTGTVNRHGDTRGKNRKHPTTLLCFVFHSIPWGKIKIWSNLNIHFGYNGLEVQRYSRGHCFDSLCS